ncbi:MAG: DUF211 domain-containing protein [Burkholderiales bacterium]|uniref:DUF211 domain-containing protein n=1 Tax=Nitrosomonas sp. TaxID=42353 RepID=UPI001E179BF3|nr:DUF211 domain-containing protein [Nitrosomonas sp.]MCB1948088.1 DUF211 domain-containing protein [Nitrosomonas sp.]MCP5244070.1 DUF211 domain-containing protein [Burkholderiales bacterium]MCP5292644.1 DUF211 domain-containing protein [Burkholderiales bacterium]
MVKVKRLILDVLKPHQPNGLAFACTLAEKCPNCHIKYTVVEVDEQTETIILSIDGDNIQFEIIEEIISTMGASIHSIDEVEVIGSTSPA